MKINKENNLDARLTIRLKSEDLKMFQDFYGKRWLDMLRKFIKEQPLKDMEIERMEQEKRNKYLNRNNSMF